MTNPFTTTQLSNGLRVVIEHMPDVKTTAAGFLARTGTRDEERALAGVSHFLEHMCFKGTEKRDGHQINADFDAIGGHPNAFTAQDRTFYHGVARTQDIDAQIELLADMMRSTIPPDEFDTEKKVVLEEIAMANDQLEHVAFDFILEQVFPGHALGWPVLGYPETLRNLTRQQMYEYFRRRYVPGNMVLIVAGSADPQSIIASAQRHCGAWEPGGVSDGRSAPRVGQGLAVKQVQRFNQQLISISFPAPAATDPLHETAQAAASILGGNNSRFYWNIMQKGLSPRAGAWRLGYSDNALLILSGLCEPENAEKLVEAMRSEAAGICRQPVKEHEIDRVKNRRRTSLAVEGESPYYRLAQVMDDVDYRGQPRTVEERLALVEQVSHNSIRECFERFPIDGEGHLVSVGPRSWPELN
ncbi:MAG: insulinase family protein [Phycisphaerae bacterium]|nr:insulinase family protein [Phycisphaerae bacterium]